MFGGGVLSSLEEVKIKSCQKGMKDIEAKINRIRKNKQLKCIDMLANQFTEGGSKINFRKCYFQDCLRQIYVILEDSYR